MAIQIIEPEYLENLPENTDGIYLIPYAWLDYGLENGYLEIEDLSFYDTLQGRVYSTAKQQNLKVGAFDESDDTYADAWLVYTPGTGEAHVVGDWFNSSETQSTRIKSKHENVIHYIPIICLLKCAPWEQIEINSSIIQLMKGCKLKLKQSVWE